MIMNGSWRMVMEFVCYLVVWIRSNNRKLDLWKNKMTQFFSYNCKIWNSELYVGPTWSQIIFGAKKVLNRYSLALLIHFYNKSFIHSLCAYRLNYVASMFTVNPCFRLPFVLLTILVSLTSFWLSESVSKKEVDCISLFFLFNKIYLQIYLPS